MNQDINTEDSAIVTDDSLYNKKTQAVPKPEKGIGIDTKDTLFQNIINSGTASKLDMSQIEAFSQVSQSRDSIYAMLDTMGEDSIISAVLETYAEDATEYNDQGQIVWVESSDSKVAEFVSYLLDTIGVDKNIYRWTYSLCKYGDLYLRLYRESECKDLIFEPLNNGKKDLNEAVNIKAYDPNDKFVHYLEMIPNPAEIFELTKFGKTFGYIQAEVRVAQQKTQNLTNSYYKYSFKKGDINIYSATNFVHACLEDNSSRTPEEVSIFLDDMKDDDASNNATYTVKRGQSLLYNTFKVWRELTLLENSVLLNRISKSSILRVINVQVGDMPKESVGPHLQGIKQLIEQKAAINEGTSLNEYTNPGPIENSIYVPVNGDKGAITTQQIGGDVDVKGLADLDLFKNKFFGSLRVPKQYFGETDDTAGFNGGTSLSIISSRYAKMVKRIQNTLIQAITDAVNLMLLDKGLDSYINNFTIHMLPPTTQEELDRREASNSKVGMATDIMNLLSDMDNQVAKLKILKSLLSNITSDSDVINVIDEEIQKLEAQEEQEEEAPATEPGSTGINAEEPLDLNSTLSGSNPLATDIDAEQAPTDIEVPAVDSTDETILPSPEDLGLDLTDNTVEI